MLIVHCKIILEIAVQSPKNHYGSPRNKNNTCNTTLISSSGKYSVHYIGVKISNSCKTVNSILELKLKFEKRGEKAQ